MPNPETDAPALSARDQEILEFERLEWRYPAAKESAVLERFAMTATRYFQVRDALLDRPEALAYDPQLVNRLRRSGSVTADERRGRHARPDARSNTCSILHWMRATDGTGQAGHYAPKHCLVQFGSSTAPGIVLGWRKTERGQWEAQVLHATGGGNVEVGVHLQWLPAPHVKPLER